MRRVLVSFFIFFLSNVFLYSSVSAKVLTAGSMELYVESSDNFFSTSSGTAVDGITYLVVPSINFTVPGKKARLNLGYTYTWEKNEVQDNNSPSVALTPNLTSVNNQGGYTREYHSVSGGVEWDITRKVNINVVGNYDINFQNIQAGQALAFSPQQQTRTDTSRVDLNALWRPSKRFNLNVGVFRNSILYNNLSVADTSTTGGQATMSYLFSKRIQIGAGAIYSNIQYDLQESLDTNFRGNIPGDASNGVIVQNFADRKNLEINANINVSFKYLVIGLTYGMLQSRQSGRTTTNWNVGQAGGLTLNSGGGGIATSLTSIFSFNIATSRRFKSNNFTFDVNVGQQFQMDLAGLPYITRVLGGGIGYRWKSVNANISIERSQDSYLDNDNEVDGTSGNFLVGWAVSKKLSISYNWNIAKYEYTTDPNASISSNTTTGPANLPTSLPNRPNNVIQEMYLIFNYSWNKWLTSGINFGRRRSETIGSFVSGAGQGIGGYNENIMSFSTSAIF